MRESLLFIQIRIWLVGSVGAFVRKNDIRTIETCAFSEVLKSKQA